MAVKCQGWPFMALGALTPAVRMVVTSSSFTASSVKYWVVGISVTRESAWVSEFPVPSPAS